MNAPIIKVVDGQAGGLEESPHELEQLLLCAVAALGERELVVQDECPDETEDELAVLVNDILRVHVLETDACVSE